MPNRDSNLDEALDGLDQSKRATLKRLLGGGAFVAPVVASFAMQGLSIRPAEAAVSGAGSRPQNGTNP